MHVERRQIKLTKYHIQAQRMYTTSQGPHIKGLYVVVAASLPYTIFQIENSISRWTICYQDFSLKKAPKSCHKLYTHTHSIMGPCLTVTDEAIIYFLPVCVNVAVFLGTCSDTVLLLISIIAFLMSSFSCKSSFYHISIP